MPLEDRMTAGAEGTEERGEREREGVLGEDKHSWGSQLLNNSARDSQHSVQRRSTVRSAHSLQRTSREGKRRGPYREREGGRAYKDSMTGGDIAMEEFASLRVHLWISVRLSRCCEPAAHVSSLLCALRR